MAVVRNSVLTYARAFVSVYGLDCARRLAEIGPRIGLEISEVDADNFEGALVRVAGVPCGEILINRSIREHGRKHFTLLHEVGHYVLPGHGDESRPCRRSDVENFGDKISQRELEANAFAAEVTMPTQVARPIAMKEPSFAAVEELSEKCGTSLTASAYRLVDCATHAVAVVWSRAGEVRWYHRSAEFRSKVRMGPLSSMSLAADYFGGKPPSERSLNAEVPAEAWLYDDAVQEGATLRESTRFLPAYDATLTLLLATSIVEARSDYMDPEDGELDPDEFSLGRRRWPGR